MLESASVGYPPTVVVVHRKEKRSKCSVEPMRGRRDFLFLDFPGTPTPTPALGDYICLDVEGPALTRDDADRGLLILDATWRIAAKMGREFADAPKRGLPSHWRTAYPRVSKMTPDPETGLATIEAIYIAYRILGRDVGGLLDHYLWAEEFLRINAAAERAIGVR